MDPNKDKDPRGKEKPKEGGSNPQQTGREGEGRSTSDLEKIVFAPGAYDGLTASPGVGERLGTEFVLSEAGDYFRVPQVISIGWFPSFGVIESAAAPVNLSARAMEGWMKAALKQNQMKFEISDALVTLYAMDSFALGFDYIKTCIEIIRTRNKLSDYMPDAFAKAYGFDLNDFLTNLPDIKITMQRWADDMRTYPTPDILPFVKQHRAMTRTIFADTDNVKQQLYVFTPTHLWSYAVVDEAKGLIPVKWADPAYPKTWRQFKQTMDGMYAAMVNSSDFTAINNAFQAIYDSNTMLKLDVGDVLKDEPGMDDNSLGVKIAVLPRFLEGLTNAWFVGRQEDKYIQTFAPKAATPINIIVKPELDKGKEGYQTIEDRTRIRKLMTVFNSKVDVPSVEETCWNGRWRPTISDRAPDPQTGGGVRVTSCGTEILEYMAIIGPTGANGETQPLLKGVEGELKYTEFVTYNVIDYSGEDNKLHNDRLLLELSLLSAFNYHPCMWASGRFSEYYNDITLPFTDWRNCYTMSLDDQKIKHDSYIRAATALNEDGLKKSSTELKS